MKPAPVALVLLLVIAAFAAGFGYGRWYGPKQGTTTLEAKKPKGYHCPMHPNFKSDKPGDCGICGMKLVPDEESGQQATPAADRKVLYYTDPRDPKYRADVPGLNPETGNDLVPVYEGDPASMPSGTVRITPDKQNLIGVKYGVVASDTAGQTVRAAGRVLADETRIAKVQTRIEGWIERVFVDFTGKYVQKGQPLLTLYSPEMLATQQEYLLALRSRDVLSKSPIVSMRGDGLVEAAKRRMQLWKLSEAEIKQIEETGKPITNVTVYSPVSGYVTQKNALSSQRVTPETELYTIVDLSRVWVMADVFEYETGAVTMGQRAVVTTAAHPGRRFSATVSYIQPQVNAETRTLQVRLELDNPGMVLRPDMFVDVELSTATKSRLLVPVNAVLNSGLRQTVFVDRGNGFLEPRQVQIGRQFGDEIEILGGLKSGERIVTSGTFLIDAESQFQSAGAQQ